jgi:DNA repair exonuclease SbcCD ATPase subunit
MIQKRQGQDEETTNRGELLAVETARSSAESSSGEKPVEPKKKDEEHISLFWRVFGGTILSIVALVVITLYNNITTSIGDLRTELSHEREARADLVKKDDVSTRMTAVFERLRGIDAVKVELEGMKEKVQSQNATLDGVRKDTAATLEAMKKDASATADAVKKDAAAVDVVKERVSALEAVKKDFAGLDVLKEKIANAATDLKAVRDEVAKLAGGLDRNKASDLERKVTRDAQYKQLEESLKELQKGLQDCREKLARLEGAKPLPGEAPQPGRPIAPSVGKPASPSTPSEVKPAGGTTTPGTGKPGPGDEE